MSRADQSVPWHDATDRGDHRGDPDGEVGCGGGLPSWLQGAWQREGVSIGAGPMIERCDALWLQVGKAFAFLRRPLSTTPSGGELDTPVAGYGSADTVPGSCDDASVTLRVTFSNSAVGSVALKLPSDLSAVAGGESPDRAFGSGAERDNAGDQSSWVAETTLVREGSILVRSGTLQGSGDAFVEHWRSLYEDGVAMGILARESCEDDGLAGPDLLMWVGEDAVAVRAGTHGIGARFLRRHQIWEEVGRVPSPPSRRKKQQAQTDGIRGTVASVGTNGLAGVAELGEAFVASVLQALFGLPGAASGWTPMA